MTVRTDEYLTRGLEAAHLTYTKNNPPPKGFQLVVDRGEIIFVFYEYDDPRIADCQKMDLDGKGELRCLGTMEFEGPLSSLVAWCEDKIAWYCGILGIPRNTRLVAA